MTGDSIPDLEAAAQVASSDLADSAAVYLAARISGDRKAIETATSTVDRCLTELRHRQADVMDAARARAIEAHRDEPEPEAGT